MGKAEIYTFIVYLKAASILKGEQMKTIIHDLGEAYDLVFKDKYENVIHADGIP